MTDKIKQKISSLVDGELDAAGYESLREQLEQGDHLQSWQRYHLIGDTLKKQLPDTLNHDLFQRVHASLESEPAILSPQASKQSQISESADPTTGQAIHKPGFFGRPVMGLGVAASIAAAAMVATQLLNVENSDLASPAQLAEREKVEINLAEQPQTAPQQAVAGLDKPLIKPRPPEVLLGQNLEGDEHWKRLDIFEVPLASPYGVEPREFSLIPGVRPHAQVVRFGEQERQ